MTLTTLPHTFNPHTVMDGPSVTANFTALNTISTLNVPFLAFNADNFQIQSDGMGNLLWSGGFGSSSSGLKGLYDGSSSTPIIKCPNSTGAVTFNVPAGTTIATVDTVTGWSLQKGTVTLIVGSLARLSNFNGTATGTYSHNMNVAPNIVLPMTNNNVPQHMGYDSVTSSTVHITAESGYPFWCQCIGF